MTVLFSFKAWKLLLLPLIWQLCPYWEFIYYDGRQRMTLRLFFSRTGELLPVNMKIAGGCSASDVCQLSKEAFFGWIFFFFFFCGGGGWGVGEDKNDVSYLDSDCNQWETNVSEECFSGILIGWLGDDLQSTVYLRAAEEKQNRFGSTEEGMFSASYFACVVYTKTSIPSYSIFPPHFLVLPF